LVVVGSVPPDHEVWVPQLPEALPLTSRIQLKVAAEAEGVTARAEPRRRAASDFAILSLTICYDGNMN
jgi:hypothetical protein